MAYKALYRKYRPINFDGVVGQKAIISTLQNMVKDNRISHAYLFSGPRGTGKTSVAKIFAKAINCLNPLNGMPCGECIVCKQMVNDQASDIIEIDAASNNGVDEIRDLKSKINLAPTLCKYKVYIIDEVHMLSIGAFNALLKTLEEPPRHVVFILATTEMHKLPLTIISRCQNYNFKKITEEQMKLGLSYIVEGENITIDDEALNEISHVSDGGMRDAIGLLEQLCSFTNNKITLSDVELLSSSVSRKEIAAIIENMIDANMEQIFKLNDSFYQNGKDFIKIAEDIVVFLKDILLYKKARKYFEKSCNYNFDSYISLFNKIEEKIIYNYIGEINRTITDIKISNHPKIIFEITLLKLVDNSTVSSKMPVNEPKSNNTPETVISVSVEDVPIVTIDVKPEDDAVVTLIDDSAEIKIDILPDQSNDNSKDDFLPFINIPLYKKIIINNTLAEANKKLLSEMNERFKELPTFLTNKNFKHAVTTLMDGKIAGVSDSNMILIYQYDTMVDKADAILNDIETFVDSVTNKKFKIINIVESVWQELRPHFVKIVKEKGKIDILPEVSTILPKATQKHKKGAKEVEEAINIFGEDIIEVK